MKAQSVHCPGGGKLPKSAELIRADSWKGNEKGEGAGEGELRGDERGGGKLFYLTLCTRQVSEKEPRGVSGGRDEEEGGGGGVAPVHVLLSFL